MKVYVSMILLLCSFLLKAQDYPESTEDSVKQEFENRFQVYIAPTYSMNQFVETWSSFAGIGLGLVVKDRIDVSLSYSQILDNFNKQIIFPSSHKYDQANISLQGQYSFLKSNIRPHAGLELQYAMATWEPEYDSNDTFSDNIFIYNAFVGVNWTLNQILTLQANAGYNFAREVEIVGLESNDFNGFNMDVLLKIRLLNF